jgi:hypothetical protein
VHRSHLAEPARQSGRPLSDGRRPRCRRLDELIAITDVTYDLARESGFASVEDLLGVAKHGSGDQVYLIRFHYLPPGAWDTDRWKPRRKTARS